MARAGGNPYHDKEGKFASGPGGGKADPAKRAKRLARRKRRRLKRRLRSLRNRLQSRHGEMRREHRSAAAELKKSHSLDRASAEKSRRGELRSMDREHESERKSAAKSAAREQAEHRRERADFEQRHADQMHRLDTEHRQSVETLMSQGYDRQDAMAIKSRTPEQIAAAKARYQSLHDEGIAEFDQEFREMRVAHQEDQRLIRENYEESRAATVKSHEQDRGEEWAREVREVARLEARHVRQAEKLRAASKRAIAEFAKKNDLPRKQKPDGVGRSIGKGRIHKASSAESILSHCLRSRGWTRQYWRGELSGSEHLELAHDVRRYGRAWLRHEAEQFSVRYLGATGHLGRSAGADDGPGALSCALDRGLGGDGGDGRLAGRVDSGDLPSFDYLQHEAHAHGLRDDGGRSDAGSIGGAWGDAGDGISRALTSDLAANFGRFFRRAKNFVRELIVGATMALTGPAPLTGEELEGLEREATKQDAFFDQLYDEIKFWGGPSPKAIKLPTPQGIPEPPRPGTPEPPVPIAFPPKPIETVRPTMTPPQFVARVERYADSSHQAAQRANRRAAVQNPMYKAERLVMGEPKTEHCSECPRDAAMGWVPLGTLRPIGERECRQLCLCHFQYSDGDGKTYVQGNRGPLPAPNPSGVRIEPESDGVELVAEPPGVTIDAPIAGPPKR